MVIDTNIFIEHLRAKNKTSTKLYQLSENSELFISAISLYELYMGANTPAKEQDIKALTEDINVLPFTDQVAVKSAQIYLLLKSKKSDYRIQRHFYCSYLRCE